MENNHRDPDVEIVYDVNDVKEEPKPIVISRNVGSPECIIVDEDSEEEITCLGQFSSSMERPDGIIPSKIKVEEGLSSKPDKDFNQRTLESGNKETSNSHYLREESIDNIRKICVAKQNVGVPSLEENSMLGKKPIGKTQQFTREIPFDANQEQQIISLRDLFQKASALSSHRACELDNTIIAVKNNVPVCNPKTAQHTFGNEHQIKRLVPIPVKFSGVNSSTQITDNSKVITSIGGKIIRIVKPNIIKQPVNKNVSKEDLSCLSNTGKPEIPKLHENSATVKTTAQGPSVAINNPKIVFVKKNVNEIPKIVKDNNTAPQPPPTMLLLNNQIIKLRGVKNHEPELPKNSSHSADIKKNNESDASSKCTECGAEQCCLLRKSTKSFVEQSTQTKIYSWIYKNSKLYTFVDDEGTQVEIEPLKTVRLDRQRKENNVPSPVSSLDYESECSDDEILVTDEPSINNSSLNKHHTAQNVSANIRPNDVGSNIQTSTSSLKPQNLYQEILFTDLGLNNKAQEPKDSMCPVYDPSNHQNQYQQETANVNTVYNHELQMYVPCSENKRSQPVLEQPTVVDPAFQRSNPVTSNTGNTALVNLFGKLVQDIKTCLTSDALGNIPLHQAAISNDLVKLKSQCIVLKTIKSHLNHINLAHETALMVAVRRAVETEDYEAVSVLVAEGADQRIADLQGNTPLHHAVRRGCDQLVRVLLSGSDVDTVTQKFNYDGFTPLHIAAMEGYDEVIKLLVGTNIDINIKDRKNGRTPYFLAVREKKRTSAQLLKMFGADVNEPNFADLAPLVFASPEKSLLQQQKKEENDDNGILEPTNDYLLEKDKVPNVSHLPQTFWTNDESFVYIDNKYDGLNLPSLLSNVNDIKKDKERFERTSEPFDAKELYNKDEKIVAKRKLISPFVEPVSLLHTRKLVKEHEKTTLLQHKPPNKNYYQNQSQCLSEKNSSVKDFESQPSFNSLSTFRDNNGCNEYDINENSNSLTCKRRKPPSTIIIQKDKCQTSQNNISSKFNENEISDNVKQPPSVSEVDIQDTVLNHNKENSVIKNLLETMGLSKPNFVSSNENRLKSCQLTSEFGTSFRTVEESTMLSSQPNLSTEVMKSDNEKETALITARPVNPKSHSSLIHEESLSTLNFSPNLSSLENSEENLNKVLKIYQLYSKDIHSGCKSNAEISSPQNSKDEKRSVVPNHKILENETYYDSSDNDECFDETNLNLNFGNLKDIIIGDGSFQLNNTNLNENLPSNSSLEARPEHLNLSYGTLLDEVVHQKKKKSISVQKTSVEISRDRKRKLIDSGILNGDKKHQKAACLEEIQNTESTDAAKRVEADNSSTLHLPKEISGKSGKNVKRPKMYFKYHPKSVTGQLPEPNSPALVNDIRNKFESTVASKRLSNTNDKIELKTLSASSKSQIEEVCPLLERRKSTGKSLLSDSESNTSAIYKKKPRIEVKTLSDSSKSQVEEVRHLTEKRRSTEKSILSVSESNTSAVNNRTTRKTTPNSHSKSQEKETAFEKIKKLTSEEDRVPNISSRKSSRTSKKKV